MCWGFLVHFDTGGPGIRYMGVVSGIGQSPDDAGKMLPESGFFVQSKNGVRKNPGNKHTKSLLQESK